MRLRYTPRAFADIESIRLYIAQFNPQAAARVVSTIETLANALTDFPEAGHPAPDIEARVLHSPRYPYRIYYRIRGDDISILHVRHTSRRPPQPGQV
jgi:plasmid stabilization system protein ParE